MTQEQECGKVSPACGSWEEGDLCAHGPEQEGGHTHTRTHARMSGLVLTLYLILLRVLHLQLS